jgi:alcohol dehydrogenase
MIARSSRPTDNNVYEGLDSDKENGCDFTVSGGRGSVPDCGKGIGIIATNGGKNRYIEGEQ